MDWVLVIGAAWLLTAAAVAVLIAGAVRLADRRAERGRAAAARRDEPNFVVQPPPPEPAATDSPGTAVPTSARPQAEWVSKPTPTPRVPPPARSATLPPPPT
jgi:hypothetical protein